MKNSNSQSLELTTHLNKIQYRADIDGLRALAVIFVVLFHAFPLLLRGGFVGVDIFFVISGFLISTIIINDLEKLNFSFIEFYSRRIRRIFPALLLVLISTYSVGWFVLLGDEYTQLGKHLMAGAGFISNLVLWNESGYFDALDETKPLLHLWSLGIEEQFYIVWPFILWITYKKRSTTLGVLLSITLISFILNVRGIHSNVTATFYSPLTRLWELSIGSLLAYSTMKENNFVSNLKEKISVRISALFLGKPEEEASLLNNVQTTLGVFLLIVAVCLCKEKSFPGLWAVLPTLGTVLIISSGSSDHDAWFNRKVLSSQFLVWFGLISFPLYLWHWPLLVLLPRIINDTSSHEIFTKVISIAISVGLAWITYILIERRFRFGAYLKAKTLSLIVLMILVGGTGYYCFKENGFKRNGLGAGFPKVVQDLSEYHYDPNGAYRVDICHLDEEIQFNSFDKCPDRWAPNGKNILIWGDSHAAHLYPGYQTRYSQSYSIIQRTAGFCPPILNDNFKGTKYCREMNGYVFDEIKKQRPERVVLSANWAKDKYNWQAVEKTVLALQAVGIKNIDLIGPVPRWDKPLSKLARRYIMNHQPLYHIPYRINSGLSTKVFKLDEKMRNFSARLHIRYISATDIFCNVEGCVTRSGDSVDTLVAWDNAHLTKAGSEFLVSHFPN